MNYGIIIKVLGNLLVFEALLMIPASLISLIYRQNDFYAFLISILLTAIVGFIMSRVKGSYKKMKAKDALAIVAIGWLLASFFGSLPFAISGSLPSFVDAFFETISGFTTTGSTVIKDVEILPKGILFWRSFTHWIGGMGIIVFTLAVIPTMGISGFQIFKAESPGPTADKIVPRIKDTARILYTTYIVITIIQTILLVIGELFI